MVPAFMDSHPHGTKLSGMIVAVSKSSNFLPYIKNFEAAITTSPRHNKINFTICMTWSFVYGQNVPLSFGEWNQT